MKEFDSIKRFLRAAEHSYWNSDDAIIISLEDREYSGRADLLIGDIKALLAVAEGSTNVVQKRKYNCSPEAREAKRERMRQLWRLRREQAA